jgi:hypothetical protein
MRTINTFLISLVCSLSLLSAAESRRAENENDPKIDPQKIIQRFADKEAEFKEVWQKYTYLQRISFQILGRGDQPRERRDMLIEVFFTEKGQRETRVLKDQGALVSLQVTKQDIDDAIGMQPFVLTTDELPAYKIKYRGKERVDELDTYVFEVKPGKKQKGKRYFQGKIWVDDLDLQIVMTEGKIVPDLGGNVFPKFLTIREQIDGEYWFPTWIEADDYLHGQHIYELITFGDFKKYDVGTSIKFGEISQDDSGSKQPD